MDKDGLSEGNSKALGQASKNWIEQLSSVSRVQVAFGQRLAEMLGPFNRAVQQTFLNIDFRWVRGAMQRAMPLNWRDFEPPDVDRVLAVMDETGWCLVWCPRQDTIRKLIDAQDLGARTRLLVDSRTLLIEDMNECLEGMSHPDSSAYRRAASLAIRAFDGGHVQAAQALAAAVISAIINGGFRLSFRKAEARFRGDPKEESLGAFREQAVYNMVARSLQQYYAHMDDPVPPFFSRHATIHSFSEEQYNEVNSLASLLLVVAFVKEADLLMKWNSQQAPDTGSSAT